MMSLLAFAPPHGFDWVIILFLVVLLFGGKKLPELARGLGRSVSEFKKAKADFDKELQDAMKEEPKTTVTPAPGAVANTPSATPPTGQQPPAQHS